MNYGYNIIESFECKDGYVLLKIPFKYKDGPKDFGLQWENGLKMWRGEFVDITKFLNLLKKEPLKERILEAIIYAQDKQRTVDLENHYESQIETREYYEEQKPRLLLPDLLWKVIVNNGEAPKEVTNLCWGGFCMACDTGLSSGVWVHHSDGRFHIELRHLLEGKTPNDRPLLRRSEIEIIEEALNHGWVPKGTTVIWENPKTRDEVRDRIGKIMERW